jgi:hypothetical protein
MSPMSNRKEAVPNKPDEIRNKAQALNYCLLVCRKSLTTLGCAYECEMEDSAARRPIL